jgi:hypothetical protein
LPVSLAFGKEEAMNEAKLKHIKFALYDMAFLDIKRASAGQSKMGAFILASCFIDYMAGFIAGREATNKDYKQIVKDYLPGLYDPEKLYKDLRCKVVHNYSEGGSYFFVDAKPALHGQKVDTKIVINLENFIDDLESALRNMYSDLDSDPVKQKKAEERYDKIGLLGIGQIAVKP